VKILITGSRKWTDAEMIEHALRQRRHTVVYHGGARGADKIADAVARKLGIEVIPFPVDVGIDGPWPMAGRNRNERMLRAALADGVDVVLVFKDDFNWRLDKGGTEHMVKIALAAGIPCEFWSHD
jgi:hypothetical protein